MNERRGNAAIITGARRTMAGHLDGVTGVLAFAEEVGRGTTR